MPLKLIIRIEIISKHTSHNNYNLILLKLLAAWFQILKCYTCICQASHENASRSCLGFVHTTCLLVTKVSLNSFTSERYLECLSPECPPCMPSNNCLVKLHKQGIHTLSVMFLILTHCTNSQEGMVTSEGVHHAVLT